MEKQDMTSNNPVKEYLNITLNKAIKIISEHRLNSLRALIKTKYRYHKNGLVDLIETYEPFTVSNN